jgi:hypothetical protein
VRAGFEPLDARLKVSDGFFERVVALFECVHALLIAEERHGAAHQRPQATQVMVRRNR